MYEIISNYLNEEFGLWGIIIFVVIISFIPILIAIISKFFEIQFFTNCLLKKKNKSWIKIYRNNEAISMCLNEYRQLMKSSEGPVTILLFYLGIFIGFLLPVLILFFIYIIILLILNKNIFQSDYFFIYAFSLSNLIFSMIPFGFTIYLSNRVKVIKQDQLESDVKIFKNLFVFVIFFSLSFTVYFLVICFSIFLNLINLNPSELNYSLIFLINMVPFIIMFISIPELFSIRNRFSYSIQTLFNKKWFKKFPNLCIITLGGVQIDGRVNDVFNTDYIILNKNGNQIITLWSSVASIEFLTH